MNPIPARLKGDRLAFADSDHFFRIGEQRTFLLRRDHPLGASPAPYVSSASEPLKGSKVCAALRDGNIILQTGGERGGRVRAFGGVFDGQRIVSYVDGPDAPGYGLQHLACSWDGDSFAGVSDYAKTNRSPIEQTLWWRPAGAPTFSQVDHR